MWGLAVDTIRWIFELEPGVLRILSPERLHKPSYTSLLKHCLARSRQVGHDPLLQP